MVCGGAARHVGIAPRARFDLRTLLLMQRAGAYNLFVIGAGFWSLVWATIALTSLVSDDGRLQFMNVFLAGVAWAAPLGVAVALYATLRDLSKGSGDRG